MGSGAAAFTAKGLRIQSVFAFALLKLRRTPRFAPQAPLGSATRSPKGEAWWARQDSNLQPDRYERPALTIELQAPPRRPREAAGNGAGIVYRVIGDPAMPGSIDRDAGEFHHFPPFLGLVVHQFAEFGWCHRLGNAADLGEPRHQLGVLQRLADGL